MLDFTGILLVISPSDNYCTQGNSGQSGTINLIKEYRDTNYTVATRMMSGSGTVNWEEYGGNISKTTSTFRVGTMIVSWIACGYIL